LIEGNISMAGLDGRIASPANAGSNLKRRGGSLNVSNASTLLQSLVVMVVIIGAILVQTIGVVKAQPASTQQDAWSALEGNPNFSDVVALLKYAGLSQYVQTDRFTAFFPTNKAFDSNPGVLESLLRQRSRAFPDTTLAVIFMRSHAIYDLHPLSEFSGRTVTLTSISGNPIEIDGTHPNVFTVRWVSVQSQFATAHIVDKPIVTSNAVIYPVDTVVMTNLYAP
jgi:uncharacterized surface protein with fasciclin (FAS1) repeats